MTAEARQHIVQRYVAEPTLPNRNALVDAHLYLCKRGARKFYRGSVDRADLEQVAAIGLIKASNRYSTSYKTPFEAYAWLIIVGELMHFVRDYEHVIRIPRGLRALEARYNAAYEMLSARLQREPSAAHLADEMGEPLRVIDELRALRTRSTTAERDDCASDPCTVENHADRLQSPYGIEDRLALAWALREISERELRIVRGVFFQERTQAEVGRELGLSQRQVSRLLTRTLDRLGGMIPA